jgi:hypothetical protein
LWRLIAGVAVFACFLGVIAALAPVYIDNLRLGSYIRALAAAPDAAVAPDDKLRAEVLDRAGRLGLPVQPNDVQITHPGGKMQLQVKYRVQTDLALYPVDLHFHPAATSR